VTTYSSKNSCVEAHRERELSPCPNLWFPLSLWERGRG
jgi:hypothetical protein